ncbi:MAG: phosphoadenylyl-sulfate reductase [Candidatus Hydrogenedentes bacterium]|nr:phosphoadenylyl-sulfate reductase [Candidatus Hydrogenedentota bacterium]
MALVEEADLLDRLNGLEAQDLLAWAATEYGERAGIFTSFQNTGCVMIDMAYRSGNPLRILTVDTLRLPDETYALMDAIEARYETSVERFQPDPDSVERMVSRHGEYLFFDSKEKQEYCCSIRKVEPNIRALQTVEVWITGLRRDQSNFRKDAVQKASYVDQEGRRIIKLAPLADWTEQEVWDYIKKYDVPYSKLYDLGYTSIGCKICTTPTLKWEDKRAGRWRWFNYLDPSAKKECGIHLSGSGI